MVACEIAQQLLRDGELPALTSSVDVGSRAFEALAPEHQLIFAQAFASLGEWEQARRSLAFIDEAALPPLLRSRAQVVLGLLARGRDSMIKAQEHFQFALRLAAASGDREQLAWAELRLFRHLIDRSSNDVLVAKLPAVRSAVMNAGTAQTATYLHECVAVLEGQLGRIDEARRHCDIADSLLSRCPNAWLQGVNLINRGCLAILSCDYKNATEYLSAARRAIVGSGHRTRSCDSNLAHSQVLTGDYQGASNTFQRLLASPKTEHVHALAAVEGLARIYLATGNLAKCQEALARIEEELANDPALKNIFHIRWASITKARMLLQQHRAADAAAFLNTSFFDLKDLEDEPLLTTIHLTRARALAMLGDTPNAAAQLFAANREAMVGVRELQGVYYFETGLLADGINRSLGSQMQRRARRLWHLQGIVSIPREIQARTISGTARDQEVHDHLSPAQAAALRTLDCVAAAFELVSQPTLFASELQSLLQLTDCASLLNSDTTVSGNAATPPTPREVTNVAFGRFRQPETLTQAISIATVQRIADFAKALHTAKEEERCRAAVWPGVLAESGDALFVAEEMQSLVATARRVATTNVLILITGETGTGKEVLAKTIHACSNRAKGTFLPFNCTSTPKDMLDSQLFGHRRGSFTGAVDNYVGVIRAAAGGTLFLDEIGDMPLDLQPKLLRFLESNEVHPIGETQPVRVDVRVIAATNANLDALVAEGRFREDLFYRLNIVRLHLPALRERRVEIPALANHYLQKYAVEYGKNDLRLAEETMEYLVLYGWPGNVRQLANEMRRAAALCETGAVVMPEHLSPEIAATRRTIPASERTLEPTEVVVRLDQPLAAATEHLERTMVQYALKKCGGHMEETAALLGLSRKGLYLKRQRFGIDPPESAVTPEVA